MSWGTHAWAKTQQGHMFVSEKDVGFRKNGLWRKPGRPKPHWIYKFNFEFYFNKILKTHSQIGFFDYELFIILKLFESHLKYDVIYFFQIFLLDFITNFLTLKVFLFRYNFKSLSLILTIFNFEESLEI